MASSSTAGRLVVGAPAYPGETNFSFSSDKLPAYDTIVPSSYSGTNPQVLTYKRNSVTVAVETLTYDGSGNLTSKVRTS